MSVGIIVRSRRHDQLRLVDRLGTAILGMGEPVESVVIETRLTGRREPRVLQAWMATHRAVVWIGSCPLREVRLARRVQTRSVCLANWPGPPDPGDSPHGCRAVDVLVTGCTDARRSLGEAVGRTDVRYIPWDCGAPVTSRPPQPATAASQVAILADGYVDACAGLHLAQSLLARDVPRVRLLLRSFRLPSSFRSRLRQTLRRSGGRLEVVNGSRLTALRVVLTEVDLVVLPGYGGGVGDSCLEALSAGCGVVCYDVPVLSEYVKDDYNGRLVDCVIRDWALGLPIAEPNFAGLTEAALELTQAGMATAMGLSAHAAFGLATRRTRFLKGWSEALGL